MKLFTYFKNGFNLMFFSLFKLDNRDEAETSTNHKCGHHHQDTTAHSNTHVYLLQYYIHIAGIYIEFSLQHLLPMTCTYVVRIPGKLC